VGIDRIPLAFPARAAHRSKCRVTFARPQPHRFGRALLFKCKVTAQDAISLLRALADRRDGGNRKQETRPSATGAGVLVAIATTRGRGASAESTAPTGTSVAVGLFCAKPKTVASNSVLQGLIVLMGGPSSVDGAANRAVASRTIRDIEERGELTRAAPVGPDLLLTSVRAGRVPGATGISAAVARMRQSDPRRESR